MVSATFIESNQIDKITSIIKEIQANTSDYILNHSSIYVVAYDDKTPIGIGNMILIKDRYTIINVFVKEEERGKKYGDLVVKMLLFKAFQNGVKEVFANVNNTNLIRFYEKIGFRINKKEAKFIEMVIEQSEIKKCCDD